MATQAAVHQRNLESNILFMQQEHANTLKALHEEIQKLQKKCSDLTFQLNVQGLEIETQDHPSSRTKELEEELSMCKLQKNELKGNLVKKETLVRELELLIKKQRMKHSEEMRHKTLEVDRLCADLESKSNRVAYLTTELHRLKRAQLENVASVLVPAPPKETPSHPSRTHMRRSFPLPESDEVGQPVRIGSGKSSNSFRPQSPAVFVKPFLREESEPKLEIRDKLPLLPPIRSASGKESNRVQPVVVHQLGSSSSRRGTKPVKLLAVDSVSVSENKWVHPQESHSSEYN